MTKIDAFAHVLLPKFYEKMLMIEPRLPEFFPFIQHPLLKNLEKRRQLWNQETKQIISYVNVNPEDYVDAAQAVELCKEANEELVAVIQEQSELFPAGVAMIPMNAIEQAVEMIKEVSQTPELVGVQIFTRALGKSIADAEFRPIFEAAERYRVPLWLHPIFDVRKPDNNIVFSWEYELTQAMLQIVQSGIFRDFPNVKILVHHAGAMVPFFAERIHYILPESQVEDFKKFYVDTAILGNPKALELTIDYYGVGHVLFGTDVPLGIAPSGATEVIAQAIEKLSLTEIEKAAIFKSNYERFVSGE